MMNKQFVAVVLCFSAFFCVAGVTGLLTIPTPSISTTPNWILLTQTHDLSWRNNIGSFAFNWENVGDYNHVYVYLTISNLSVSAFEANTTFYVDTVHWTIDPASTTIAIRHYCPNQLNVFVHEPEPVAPIGTGALELVPIAPYLRVWVSVTSTIAEGSAQVTVTLFCR